MKLNTWTAPKHFPPNKWLNYLNLTRLKIRQLEKYSINYSVLKKSTCSLLTFCVCYCHRVSMVDQFVSQSAFLSYIIIYSRGNIWFSHKLFNNYRYKTVNSNVWMHNKLGCFVGDIGASFSWWLNTFLMGKLWLWGRGRCQDTFQSLMLFWMSMCWLWLLYDVDCVDFYS